MSRWSRSRRCASVVVRCPGLLTRPCLRKRFGTRRLLGLLALPVTRRLLAMAGIAVAGWLLGAAGQAHADTVPGARLPSAVAHTGRHVIAITRDMPPLHAAAPAVHVPGAVLRHSRLPLIPAAPSRAAGGVAGAVRPGTSEVTADPSRAPRHPGHGHGHRAAAGRGPVTSTGPFAATGASEKASADHATRSRVPAPAMPRMPQQLPHRAQALPPSVGDGVIQTGLWRAPGFGAASGRSRASALIVRTVPPAVRTAADEPSFSPD
ncbi:hypothetical protein NE236_10015 [Actinoallomurus purpureus]|uniref:hypothetical protein n=1 Tax=Actinoallomurus purpureus TaxID=478114 RepID=UPI002092CFE2|nr:hypothetical protein [Actinoallomurus purpureus]MCO6005320.1 hypothetical protein [Actinoallomurus purpureus]